MRTLVYGAGIVGSLMAHKLCAGGNEVTVLARGQRLAQLREQDLVIRHALQHRTTVDHPLVIEELTPDDRYDIVFAVMQYSQMGDVLPALAANCSPIVALVGNNMSSRQMAAYLREHSAVPKEVVFGFLAAGGRREKDRVVSVHGRLPLRLGGGPGPWREHVKHALAPGDAPVLCEDMASWYACHLAFVLPVAFVCYATGLDLRKATQRQLTQAMDAAAEGFAALKAIGCAMEPAGVDRPFTSSRGLTRAVLWLVAKTRLGEWLATEHCRHAADEMAALSDAFDALRRQSGLPMPHWDALQRALPRAAAMNTPDDKGAQR